MKFLAERAGVTLGFYAGGNRDEWQRKALKDYQRAQDELVEARNRLASAIAHA